MWAGQLFTVKVHAWDSSGTMEKEFNIVVLDGDDSAARFAATERFEKENQRYKVSRCDVNFICDIDRIYDPSD